VEDDKEDPLPFAIFDRILAEEGPEAYVAKLVEVYGRHIRRGGPKAERVFRQVRVGYVGFKDEKLFEIYAREMLKLMPEDTRKAVQEHVDSEFQRKRRRRANEARQAEQEEPPGFLRRIRRELFGPRPAK
jgi:hypothetical protein